jgi:glycosyltransferase involved in cell wall biosynthesis
MKVLFFSPYPPYPPTFGGTVRIYNLMRQVARRHDVYSLCYVSPFDPAVDRSPLKDFVVRHEEVSRPHPERKRLNQARSMLSRRSFQNIAHLNEAMQRALDQIVADEQIDVIVVEFSQMACFDFPDGPAIVIDEHNVEWDLLYREYLASPPSLRKLYQLTEYQKFRREEMKVLSKADVVTVTSPRDRELLLKHDPTLDIDVVENGVDVQFFRPAQGLAEPDTMVFTGTMHYHPNTQAARFFVEEILPRVLTEVPAGRFIGAGGRVLPELEVLLSESVHFTGYVEDIREWFHKASVLVVPLLVGGGTRFKVVEAMAVGKPVVSTRLGAEGISVTHGENIMLADDPNSFAAEVVDLLNEPERAAEMGRAGRRFVEEHFAWDVIGARLERALQKAVSSERVG